MTMFRPATAAAVALFACLSAPAIAQDDRREPVQARISYADLDLDHEAGREVLRHRIDRAIRHACSVASIGSRISTAYAPCMREMHRDADVKVAALMPRGTVTVASRR